MINVEGLALLKESESFVGHAYPDPVSPLGKALQTKGLWRKVLSKPGQIPPDMLSLDGTPWTLGWGMTKLDGKPVQADDRITKRDGDKLLLSDIAREEQAILAVCRIPPTENQLSAFICLVWNIGMGNFAKSTALKAHNRCDFQSAGRAFKLFDKARGKTVPALTTRRAAESALYLKDSPAAPDAPDALVAPESIPQKVDNETSLARSPIIAGSTIAGTTATVGAVAEGAKGVRDIRDSLGDWLPWIVGGAAIVITGFVVFQRWRQRRGGWV